jgi:predicted O-methyltransferase YrrM
VNAPVTGATPDSQPGLGPSSVVRISDPWRLLARLPFAWRLAGAAIEDPVAFRIMVLAVRRHHAMQKPLELFKYLSLLRRARVARVMEIGTLWGGTFYAHCAVADTSGQLISIDSQPGDRWKAMAARLERFARGRQVITCIHGDSHSDTAARQVDHALKGRSLDVLFLDGDHSLDGVKRDFDMYSPLVRPGGIVALHDIDGDVPAGTGIPAFWRSLGDRFRTVAFIDRRHGPRGLGIGVVVKD